jgi:Methylene-tetrahydrofolate reductase C terminal
MRAARHWSVRHARGLETTYRLFERAVVALDPVWRRLGYGRLERPVAAVEHAVKGFLFDCRMCGQCVLSSTGMSCPMNCPKELRNGPCGGVRADGRCEVDAQMQCVWVEAITGSARMRDGSAAVHVVQFAVDHRLAGRSSWLAAAREKASNTSNQARGTQ